MINVYETKAVKKHITKVPNPGYENTRMDACSRVLWVGGSGSGKTVALTNFLTRSSCCFSKVIVCNLGIAEPIYECWKEEMKGFVTFYVPETLPNLTDLVKGKKKEERWLLVLDDVIANMTAKSNIYQYFIASRKENIDCHLLSQSYFKTNKLIRSNLTYLCLLRIGSDKDLKLILSDAGSMGVTREMLMSMYKESSKDKFNFLKIALDETDMNKRFSHNFTDFFELEESESGDTTS